jgi:hypothetical protein
MRPLAASLGRAPFARNALRRAPEVTRLSEKLLLVRIGRQFRHGHEDLLLELEVRPKRDLLSPGRTRRALRIGDEPCQPDVANR